MEQLAKDLFEIGAVKFGTFKLKSGIASPFYVDLRVAVSYPRVLRSIAALYLECLQDFSGAFDVICGVPYTALPFATAMAVQGDLPMVMCRKEVKDHGTRRVVEGAFTQGSRCLIIEDVVTSGSSILEVVGALRAEGLKVDHAIVLLDREQGGCEALLGQGIGLRSVFRISNLVGTLRNLNLLEPGKVDMILDFICTARAASDVKRPETNVPSALPVAASSSSPVRDQLYSIAEKKRSILCVAADVQSTKELLGIADAVGPHICVLKLHADIIQDWTTDTSRRLRELADKHSFMLFEDRKFADIGNTVVAQFSAGVHRISSWADIVNAHAIPGPGLIEGLRHACAISGRMIGLLLVAQMSSKGNLIDERYTATCLRMAREAFPFCIGFIAQERLDPTGKLFVMAPGVQLDSKGDQLGQQYNSPEYLLKRKGVDFLIVGRGIYGSEEPAKAAQMYKELSWSVLHG